MANIDITDQGGGSLSNGVLQLENGVAMDTTLRYVADQLNTKSQLLLATNATTVEGTLKIKTANVEYLDVEDIGGNNRFTISKAVGSQKVDLDFASNPTSPTDIVGGIRTFQDGVNLSDSLFFRKNGQATFTERVNVEGDSSVTTQTSSVISASTTNANLVIAPNGNGALIADIPDGTAAGGNARGDNAVDLQMSRNAADKVASGVRSFVFGRNSSATSSIYGSYTFGENCNNSGQASSIMGGESNTITSSISFIGGGLQNSISSSGSTISGGQSNTASTGTHATVVGGQSNTSSGAHSISGGFSNTNSGSRGSLVVGYQNTNTEQGAFVSGQGNTNNGQYTLVSGLNNRVSQNFGAAIGTKSKSYLIGQSCIGNDFGSARGISANQGDFQSSQFNLFNQDALLSGGTMLLNVYGYLTGTIPLVIPDGNNRSWNVQVRWVAVVTAITGTATGVTVGDTKTSTDLLAVARRTGTTTVSAHTSAGTHAIETVAGSLAAANITYTAGASQEMEITFTAPTFAGGGSVTMRVVAAISLTEVAY